MIRHSGITLEIQCYIKHYPKMIRHNGVILEIQCYFWCVVWNFVWWWYFRLIRQIKISCLDEKCHHATITMVDKMSSRNVRKEWK